jgi:hypothetical protein
MKTKIKKAQICDAIESYELNVEMASSYVPKMGDVGIFRVVTANSAALMDGSGVARHLFDEDIIMAAFGNRYATSQIEGYVPDAPTSNCQLLGRGGVVGTMKSLNATVRNQPAELELLGFAVDAQGLVLNTIKAKQLTKFHPHKIKSKVILSIGTSMDSGKTTTAAYLCAGLKKAGHSAAYIKLTGTAFPKDARFCVDRGADMGIDFAHFGFPSTFLCSEQTLLDLYQSLVDITVAEVNPEYIVMEIADGILQRETAMLLNNSRFMQTVHQVIFSCGDSLGVQTGLDMLRQMGIKPFAISGLFTSSELLIQEVERICSTPILRLSDLLEGTELTYLLEDKSSLNVLQAAA